MNHPRIPRSVLAAALAAAVVGPLASGARPAAADTPNTDAPAVVEPGLLTADGRAFGPARLDRRADQPVSLIVRLSGPPLWDLYQAARDRAGAKGTDAVLPASTLATWRDAIAARQAPAARAIEALGADVVSRYRVVENGFLVHARRDLVPAIARVPGVVLVAHAPVVTVDLDTAVGHVGATKVQALGFDGEDTIVAVIDTGIDYMHKGFGGEGNREEFVANDPNDVETEEFPTDKVVGGVDLAGSLYASDCPPPQITPDYRCTTTPEIDVDPLDEMYADGGGGQGHGSHVAGIAAGEGTVDAAGKVLVPAGVAPGARLVAVKIFGNPRGPLPQGVQGAGGTDLVVDGLEWIVEHNLAMDDIIGWPALDADGKRLKINVVNMSVGGPWGGGMYETDGVVGRAVEAGVTVVMSAGNNGNTPYITGSPAAAEMAVSVASTFASGELKGSLKAEWDAGTLDAAAELPSETLAVPLGRLDPASFAKLPLARYGLACTDSDTGMPSEPAEEIDEKVALIERGTCTFVEKLRNAHALGAIAAVVFTDQARPDAIPMGGECWPDSTCVPFPALMVDFADGQRLRQLREQGTEVLVTFGSGPNEQLTDTVSDFSSRGPDRLRGGVKPQVAAPGSNILSVWAGTGDAAVSIGGTSMSSPMTAGVAALLWQRNREQELGLSAADVGALIVNNAKAKIHVSGNNTGPLVGVTRQGAGLVDAFASATTETVVRSDTGVAELGFATVPAADEPVTQTRTLTVHNLGDAAKTYKAGSRFVFPGDDAGKGAQVTVEPAQLTVPAGGSGELTVRLTVSPAQLRPWSLTDTGREITIADVGRFQTLEVDGIVDIAEVDAQGQPVAGGDTAGVPFTSLPQRRSCVGLTTTTLLDLAGGGTVEHNFGNACAQPGGVATYLHTAHDPSEPATPGKIDITDVGVRWFASANPDPSFPNVRLQVLEFVVHTPGTRRLPLDTEIRLYFDTDRDGKFDRVAFSTDFDPRAADPTAPGPLFATLMADLVPDSIEPDLATAFDENGSQWVNIRPYDIDESTAVLRMFANHPRWGIGADMTTGDVKFNFAVSAGDAAEDFAVTDDFLGYDLAPDGLEDGALPGRQPGESFAFDQALLNCALGNLREVPSGAPINGQREVVTVAARGQSRQTLQAGGPRCRAADFGLLMHYPWNLPEETVEIRRSRPYIYLPFAAREFDMAPPPTAEPMPGVTPTVGR